jgi:anti-anti-sigma factor
MNHQIEKRDNIAIFFLKEKRLDANISGLVKGEFTNLVRGEGIPNLILDLTETEQCDSSGLSALLVANRLVSALGGELRIVTASDKIMTLIRITQLDRVLMLSESIEKAIKDIEES